MNTTVSDPTMLWLLSLHILSPDKVSYNNLIRNIYKSRPEHEQEDTKQDIENRTLESLCKYVEKRIIWALRYDLPIYTKY